MDETQKAAKFVAQRFTLVFNVPEEISLRSLCTELGYSVPNTDTPYAEKVLADGSFVRVSPRDRVLKTVTVERVGPLEDWGAMRFRGRQYLSRFRNGRSHRLVSARLTTRSRSLRS